jgi:hypothetical protein
MKSSLEPSSSSSLSSLLSSPLSSPLSSSFYFKGCSKSAVGGSDLCTAHGGGKRCKFEGMQEIDGNDF